MRNEEELTFFRNNIGKKFTLVKDLVARILVKQESDNLSLSLSAEIIFKRGQTVALGKSMGRADLIDNNNVIVEVEGLILPKESDSSFGPNNFYCDIRKFMESI